MKTQNILPVFLLLFLVSSVQGWSQKRAEKDTGTITFFYLDYDGNEKSHTISSTGTKVFTPSENFLKTYKFVVEPEIMEDIDFGGFANMYVGVKLPDPSNSQDTLKALGYLNKAGILNVEIHKNGAGKRFPRGWF